MRRLKTSPTEQKKYLPPPVLETNCPAIGSAEELQQSEAFIAVLESFQKAIAMASKDLYPSLPLIIPL